MKKSILLAIILLCAINLVNAQKSILQEEQKLKLLFEQLAKCTNDTSRIELNNKISNELKILLLQGDSFDYPFDSIKNMGKMMSPDKAFRIYSWNIIKNDRTYDYFTFIQKQVNKNTCVIEQLFNKGVKSESSMTEVLDANSWLGALYYQIIPFSKQKKDYYILMGWDGNNHRSNRKLIEVLHFDKNGKALFGDPVISWRGKLLNRVIFEYAEQARISLKYDGKQLIFDHLAPSSPRYKGQYEYYGPDFSYDALLLKNGIWTLIEDIDIKN